MLAWIRLWDLIYFYWSDENWTNYVQQQDTYILAILGGHKHCFKVKSSALILQEHFALFVIKDYEYPFFFETHKKIALERSLTI